MRRGELTGFGVFRGGVAVAWARPCLKRGSAVRISERARKMLEDCGRMAGPYVESFGRLRRMLPI